MSNTAASAHVQHPPSRAYPQSGYVIMRHDTDYMMVRCDRVPFAGITCHYHNDALSFELQAGGCDFIIDPGTYVYTADPEWRNRFRSTLAHNTVVVNGQEQNRFARSVFDYVGDVAKARCVEWRTSPSEDRFVGEHDGYRVGGRVTRVQRNITYAKLARHWHIVDTVKVGVGLMGQLRPVIKPFIVTWRFHLHPEVSVEQGSDARSLYLVHVSGQVLEMVVRGDNLRVAKEQGWVSFRYGQKDPATVICVETTARRACEAEFLILVHRGGGW